MRFDATGRESGRGAYVCRDDSCITGATAKGALGRALETTTMPTDLTQTLLTAARGGGTDGP